MAFFTGRSGSIKIGAKTVAKIRDWSIETTVELLSTNTIDSGVNTFVPGVKGATGSATLVYYRLEGNEGNTQEQFTTLLGKVMTTDDKAPTTIKMELNVGGGSKDDIVFDAYITSASVSVSTGELTVVPINFTVDGEFEQVINA